MGRRIPIGYKMVDGKTVIDEEKAGVVKQVFSDYLNGISTDKIAEILISKGIYNPSGKISWSYGTVRKILVNIKYLGDEMHPQIIDENTFELVQKRREEIARRLGKSKKLNSPKKQDIFINKIRCGQCGESYREYVKNTGKPSEVRDWKCKRYINQNKIKCKNLFLTNEDIENIFISATNKLLSRLWLLDKKKKKEPIKMSLEIREIEERIKELEEEEEKFSSKELSELIFKRAKGYYSISKIDDYEYKTEKVRQALEGKERLEEFDEDLFKTIIKQIIIQMDRKIVVEFINEITMEEDYEDIRKDG